MKHHYLPKFYLKRWESPSKEVTYYKIKHGRIIEDKTYTEGAGYEVDLYARKNVSEDQKHIIETDFYKPIDDKAARISQKILTTGIETLTPTERNDFSQFLISLLFRHSNIIENAKTHASQNIKNHLNTLSLEERLKYEASAAQFEENLAVNTTTAMISPINSHFNPFNVENSEKYINTLMGMVWWIEDFTNLKHALLTCDHPLALSTLDNDLIDFSTLTLTERLINEKSLLSIPLSPTICFYAHANRKILFPNKKELLKCRNLTSIERAIKFIYACENQQKSFVENNFLISPSLKLRYAQQIELLKQRQRTFIT